jgi:hypothetical protein
VDNDIILKAFDIVSDALIEAAPAPEDITVANPASVPVDWDAEIDPARRDKTQVIRHAVRGELRFSGVLHQLPQLLLIADGGACIELFGGLRTGTASRADTPGGE